MFIPLQNANIQHNEPTCDLMEIDFIACCIVVIYINICVIESGRICF